MIRSVLVIGFLFSFLGSYAQEELMEMTVNPQVVKEYNSYLQKKESSRLTAVGIYTDTISLPFIDDFSRDHRVSWFPDTYPASAYIDTVAYNFTVNDQLLDSLRYMLTPSYTYFFNTSTSLADSVQNDSMKLSFFINVSYPFAPDETIFVWPDYYQVSYDGLGNVIDSNYVTPDSIIYKTIIDTISLARPSAVGALWFDHQVYLNNHFPVNPPTMGVATFDGLDSTGFPYDFTNPSGNIHGWADMLTSMPLDLSLGSNFYLSFYYQAQGRGNAPESADSLRLEFKGPNTGWTRVWSVPGYTMGNDTAFKQVILPVNDPLYMQKGFQFRFRNHATLSGSLDHWHLDYVRLDKNRTATDTIPDDVAFVSPNLSMIHNYESVPYNHYKEKIASEWIIDGSISATFKNLSDSTANLNYLAYVTRSDGTDYYDFPGGSNNFAPFSRNQNNFLIYKAFSGILPEDSVMFNVTHTNDVLTFDINPENDQITYQQKFYNYYAYDDGTAESGYGMNFAGSMLAMRYDPWKSDTLKAVQLFFNPMIDNANGYLFRLTIWNDDGGKPGTILYQKGSYDTVLYDRGGANIFHQYTIDPFYLAGPYYVGFVQTTTTKLNLGLDRNIDNSSKMFFNTSGSWNQTQFTGSWMIRPVYGNKKLVGINDQISENDVLIYPNPASDRLDIDFKFAVENIRVELFNSLGQCALKANIYSGEQLDISGMQPGVYFIKVYYNNSVFNKKLIISK